MTARGRLAMHRHIPRLLFLAGFLFYSSASRADNTATETAPATPPSKEAKVVAIENSVVKIFSTLRYPEPFRPWVKQAPVEATGSGVIIDSKHILTNAHVVLYANQVQVQGNQSGDKFSATVVAVAPGIDLALLTLDDESFFAARPPIPRANLLPEIKDPVLAYGFPTGGTSLSITKGIVSRIEFASYNFPVGGLRIQIDAAINPGNSGGPAIAGDKMIGLAFSVLGGAQNIGYIIPNEEIDLFLNDIADGHYDGKPAMFDETQKMQNPAIRAFLKIKKDAEGVVVMKPFDNAPSYPLKKWDVITKIGDSPVDDEGMVKIGRSLRVSFEYLVQKVAVGGKVDLIVIRDQKEERISLPVSPNRPLVIPDLNGGYPSYFVYGPVVFSSATQQMLNNINRDSVVPLAFAGSPLMTRRGDAPQFPGEQVVVVSAPLFPHKLSQSYGQVAGWTVSAINGVIVKNLTDLVQQLHDAKSDFITIEFLGRGEEAIVLPRSDSLKATEEILSDNGVRSQGSADTMSFWEKPFAK